MPCEGFDAPAAVAASKTGSYRWEPSDHASFFPGRQAAVVYNGARVGVFGVVHPDVLAAFEVVNPVSALEINIEPFCFDQHGRSLLRRVDIMGSGDESGGCDGVAAAAAAAGAS